MAAKRYYVIEIVDWNSDQAKRYNTHEYRILSEPVHDTDDREVIDGDCGSYNNVATYAHGEFPNLRSARAEIRSRADGAVARWEPDANETYDRIEPPTVEVYVHKLTAIDRDDCGAYIAEGLNEDIHANTTDEEIRRICASWERGANGQGLTLPDAIAIATERRDSLREDAAS